MLAPIIRDREKFVTINVRFGDKNKCVSCDLVVNLVTTEYK